MIGFAAPWVLVALVLLPAIWWLLRVTPPTPLLVRFPAMRLLRDLPVREESPARMPLWLILLRLFLAALLIVALAGPTLRPGAVPPGRGPEVIVIDNGWAAADSWSDIQASLLAEIDRAQRAGMPVVLIPTAKLASNAPIEPIGPATAAEARRSAEKLEPMPWPGDREAAAKALLRFDARSPAIWLSDGIASPDDYQLTRTIASYVEPKQRVPLAARLPHLLFPPEATSELALKVRRATKGAALPITLVARAADGRVIGEASGSFGANDRDTLVRFDLPVEIRNSIKRITIGDAVSAGETVLLDERARRRPVAIVAARAGEAPSELLSGAFYLERALQPFAEVQTGELAAMLRSQPSVLILTDATVLSPGDMTAISAWVAKGGLLLRFAGPNLAAADPTVEDRLLPTILRTGGRSLAGAMSWTQPASLSPFPEDSPFAGLDIPPDVTVSRQILAEPVIDLDKKVWARLADGTPLITADRRGDGTVVLVHTSADASWSNLALSGLFPQMLRRIVAYSAGVGRTPQHGVLEPNAVLDGFGRLHPAGGATVAINAETFDYTFPDPEHPPGYYGETDSLRALNLTQTIADIAALGPPPAGIERQTYAKPGEVSLTPALLAAALLLAAIDTVIALWLGGSLPKPRLRWGAAVLLLALTTHGATAAETDPAQAASEVTLGYVVTGDAGVDKVSRAGLEGLVRQLVSRTSIDHAAPAAVNLEQDELAVYPLLYWPAVATAPPLSDRAKDKLNRYLATGGMVLIDSRGGADNNPATLRKMVQGIEIPALAPLAHDHVLTKSFFLLDEFPGRFAGGTVWVERDQDTHNDGVSSVVIGSADWAGAWATDKNGVPLFDLAPGGERQREWAYRFGVNVVMYALTGNYKADLVHAPYIQQRLGQ
jgi:hypothetical protein